MKKFFIHFVLLFFITNVNYADNKTLNQNEKIDSNDKSKINDEKDEIIFDIDEDDDKITDIKSNIWYVSLFPHWGINFITQNPSKNEYSLLRSRSLGIDLELNHLLAKYHMIIALCFDIEHSDLFWYDYQDAFEGYPFVDAIKKQLVNNDYKKSVKATVFNMCDFSFNFKMGYVQDNSDPQKGFAAKAFIGLCHMFGDSLEHRIKNNNKNKQISYEDMMDFRTVSMVWGIEVGYSRFKLLFKHVATSIFDEKSKNYDTTKIKGIKPMSISLGFDLL